MIVMLEPDSPESVVSGVLQVVSQYKGVTPRTHVISGAESTITEIYLLGSTSQVPVEAFQQLAGVRQVVRVSQKYRMIGRHSGQRVTTGFEYNGVTFDDRSVNIFAGLCAVDTPQSVDAMMAALARCGIQTTRMGAYKPRTNPYEFQGLGASCLPWVFESAGRHGVKVVAMEVTHPRHIDEIRDALEKAGNPTGVMLQVGTRNAQNFELLKSIGQQREFPVLFKRGMGITLEESLNACEYVASEGNAKIVFCLRGVKTHLGDPHRNMVDFAHVPVVRRLTRLPVCVDPSHAIGRAEAPPDGLPDIFHAIGQGIIAGASMVLVDFHPQPEAALCDGPQALRLEQLKALQRYVQIVRGAYDEVVANGDGMGSESRAPALAVAR
ncbi:3-deoxy-7-phosphoheptulonate synthase [Corallococcus sp. H22C18031201]|uniref:3-deoxy-7-phosphoheptulonate synthase n=1 Tax=Citreicoccus inhibens TaxID=2849499 RepID=UPI000E75CDB8|nr:3-deoxy-7-phosphoheptulonate synthase [Citreicoccus inhibens]MBU8900609.1 3-deoxy-7-phosphoheptulonate synthase [Citreicoccus inhibens]RJS16328.1 3-deoxy-7-phosphoheptulonate synthase [Corallococcus sp. H22C18031201]